MTATNADSPNLTDKEPRPTRLWALIPCAGTGSRAGIESPKQYEKIAGRIMVTHTLSAFAAVSRVHRTVVVVAPGDAFLRGHADLASIKQPNAPLFIADCGGSTRADSVMNGLKTLLSEGAAADDWVLVHDAARCLVTPAWINRLIDACERDAVGGLLALPLPDTLKMGLAGRVAATLDRSDKWLAQTPQMFRIGALREALVLTGGQVTDEASAIEAAGLSPRLVVGSAQNIKITYPEDFSLAQAVLLARQNHENNAHDHA